MYLKQFAISKKSNRQELNDLIVKAKNGDSSAKDKIFRQHIKLVFKHVKKILPYSTTEYRKQLFNDAVQEGFIGLNRAIEKFNPDNQENCSFSTYAYYWIRVYILKFIMGNYSLIKIKSQDDKNLFYKFSDIKYLDSINDEEERARLEKEVVSSIKNADYSSLDQVRKTINTSIVSLDGLTTMEDTPYKLHDVVSNESSSQEELLQQKRLREEIEWAMSYLKPQVQYVVKKRFLDDSDEKLATIGKTLKVSGERVRQIEEYALAKLKRLLEDKQAIKERIE